jgi:hypothetical protein
VFFDGVMQMDGMFFTNIFNSEVVYDESEHDGPPFVAPKTGGAFALVVAFRIVRHLARSFWARIPDCWRP